jgi:hypothetical protein
MTTNRSIKIVVAAFNIYISQYRYVAYIDHPKLFEMLVRYNVDSRLVSLLVFDAKLLCTNHHRYINRDLNMYTVRTIENLLLKENVIIRDKKSLYLSKHILLELL